jgi:hypothetical protein
MPQRYEVGGIEVCQIPETRSGDDILKDEGSTFCTTALGRDFQTHVPARCAR